MVLKDLNAKQNENLVLFSISPKPGNKPNHSCTGCSGKAVFFHNSMQPLQPSAGEEEVANSREFLEKTYLMNTL